jgi:SAM-dependent methyltransferase
MLILDEGDLEKLPLDLTQRSGRPMSKNIVYQGHRIGDFYATHRRRWQDFYPSERRVFETLAARGATFATILDVGCAAGGLGEALSERFDSIREYTGIDINTHAVELADRLARETSIAKRFIVADVCNCTALAGHAFDLVTLLSVADWNVDAWGIVAKCWEHVRPNGHLVISLRLTLDKTICDIARSYQYIWFDTTPPPADADRAPYNVFNIREAVGWLAGQAPRPEHLYLYGFWGKPSTSARTPYDRLLFSVIALRKPSGGASDRETEVELHLPASAYMQVHGAASD